MRRNLLLAPIAFAAVLAPAPLLAFQGSAIVPSKEGGRTIYVDDSTPPKTTLSRSSARGSGALVYWSQAERRWKAVPSYTPSARRQARYAAADVQRYIASLPRTKQAAGGRLLPVGEGHIIQALWRSSPSGSGVGCGAGRGNLLREYPSL